MQTFIVSACMVYFAYNLVKNEAIRYRLKSLTIFVPVTQMDTFVLYDLKIRFQLAKFF